MQGRMTSLHLLLHSHPYGDEFGTKLGHFERVSGTDPLAIVLSVWKTGLPETTLLSSSTYAVDAIEPALPF